MPGTIQTEIMLQTIVATIYCDESLKIDKCLIIKSFSNYYDMINKTGKLEINAKILRLSRGIVEAKASIIFKNKIVSKGNFNFILQNNFKK